MHHGSAGWSWSIRWPPVLAQPHIWEAGTKQTVAGQPGFRGISFRLLWASAKIGSGTHGQLVTH